MSDSKKPWKSSSKFIGILLSIVAIFGLIASFVLIHETLAVAKNPGHTPVCDISPLVSCASVMSEPSSEILGLPFPVFGTVAFGALLAFAVLLAVGTKFAPIIWKLAIGVAGAGLLAVAYMMSLSMFSYGTICPWCFCIWLVTIATFWAIVTYVASARPFKLKGRLDSVATVWSKYAPIILLGTYVFVLFILLVRFSEVLI